MSHKSGKIAGMVAHLEGREWPAHYLGFFECFNQGLYYEAHDVLEELWLPVRKAPEGDFYKGLIQLAGAFVHFQKDRLRPAGALLRLARENLGRYPERHEGLDLATVKQLAAVWLGHLETGAPGQNPFCTTEAPRLALPGPRG